MEPLVPGELLLVKIAALNVALNSLLIRPTGGKSEGAVRRKSRSKSVRCLKHWLDDKYLKTNLNNCYIIFNVFT